MAISFASALGVHEEALLIRERRAEVLATNLANADTPGFKARDFDFRALVQEAIARPTGTSLETTRAGHIGAVGGGSPEGALLYRIPMQPSLDGNTVDTDLEMASFARNSLDFQASLTFLQSKFRGLKSALRGD
jgi:flagellar basal-body rod protein FlgB